MNYYYIGIYAMIAICYCIIIIILLIGGVYITYSNNSKQETMSEIISQPSSQTIQPNYSYSSMINSNIVDANFNTPDDQSPLLLNDHSHCCTRIYINNNDVTPAELICDKYPQCKGFVYNGNTWATLKDKANVSTGPFTVYLKK